MDRGEFCSLGDQLEHPPAQIPTRKSVPRDKAAERQGADGIRIPSQVLHLIERQALIQPALRTV